jgi:hypothetical protein
MAAINLDEAIAARQEEVDNYDFNIANYEGLLQQLSSQEWPDHLLKYKGRNNGDVVAGAQYLTLEDAITVSRLNMRDDVQRRLMAEKLERDRAALVLQVMKARKAAQDA